ncbi:hypothetical protein F5148DRAFT_1197052 [Russula earlei]|uniref:Uncharacterized protein n=1 Tax=Russula earlei TaxID=71964 RepID=A0ACC0UAY2_9AGAM|nr:hypothetical protein F5148DRAFT_1197052 [Russula earlei]
MRISLIFGLAVGVAPSSALPSGRSKFPTVHRYNPYDPTPDLPLSLPNRYLFPEPPRFRPNKPVLTSDPGYRELSDDEVDKLYAESNARLDRLYYERKAKTNARGRTRKAANSQKEHGPGLPPAGPSQPQQEH